MARYRFSRTLPTGWRIRLDYVPWDGDIDDTVTEVDDITLIEIGEQTTEFDDLPFGLIQPQTLKIKLAFNRLPSALQEYLRTGRESVFIGPPPKSVRRNIFVLFSDRGTAGATWTTEYVGCEDDVEGFTITPSAGDVYEYEVELVDIVYHAMKTLTGADAFIKNDNTFPRNPSDPQKVYRKLFYVLLRNLTGCNQYQNGGEAYFMNVNDVLTWMMRALRDQLINYYLHGSSFLTVGVFGLDDVFTSALELKKCNVDNYDRVAGDALTKTTAYLTTHAGLPGLPLDEQPGGILGKADKFGWAREDVTLYDVIRDLTETLGAKMMYSIDFTTTGLGTVTSVTFTPRRIGSPLSGDNSVSGYDAQIASSQMLERPNIGRGENNIGKAETRWESEYSEDIKEISRLMKGSNGSRSVNIEPIIHNAPTFLNTADEDEGRSGPLLQTNLIYFAPDGAGTNTLVLAHEDTRYYYLPGSPGNYVQATTTAGLQPLQQTDDNAQKYRIQLNSIQAGGCMPYTLTKLMLHVFANPDNAVVETSWNAIKSPTMLPNNAGGVYDLSTNSGGSGGTTDFATVLPNLAWTRAVLTSSSHNWMTGEISTKFFLLAATGNLG